MRPSQHVVRSLEGGGIFERDDVLGLLDDEDGLSIAARVVVDGAALAFGQVEGDRAMANGGLEIADRIGQAEHVVGVLLEQVEDDAFRRPRPDAGQAGELLHELLNNMRSAGHKSAQTVRPAPVRHIDGLPIHSTGAVAHDDWRGGSWHPGAIG